MDSRYINWLKDKGISPTAYSVDETGRVWSIESEKYLTPQINKDNYHEVDLKWETNRTKQKVHRLVCQAFHGPPPDEDSEVDHLDMDRGNNSKSNLEWVSKAENIQRRNASGSDPGGKTKKPVVLTSIANNTCLLMLSHSDAIKYLVISAPTFYEALSKDREINGYYIYPLKNPEVLNNERNQNKAKQGDSSRIDTTKSPITSGTSSIRFPGTDDGSGGSGSGRQRGVEGIQGIQGTQVQVRAEEPLAPRLSEAAERILAKWGNKR